MSYWSELDESNTVIRVTVGDNNDPAGDEGYQWLIDNLGGRWVKTSFNTYGNVHSLGGTPFRKNYGAIGFTYDETRDAFIPPKFFESWVLDEETCLWKAPIIMPADGKDYKWDEATTSWIEVE